MPGVNRNLGFYTYIHFVVLNNIFAWNVAGVGLGMIACGLPPPEDLAEEIEQSMACDLGTGELLVSELMVAPSGDATEWLELYNPGVKSLPLAGLSLSIQGSGEERVMGFDPAWTVGGRRFFVIAAYPTVPDDARGGTLRFRLADQGAAVRLRCGETVVDTVEYGSFRRELNVVRGASLSREIGVNAGGGSWCEGARTYDGSNRGTPGAANPVCDDLSTRDDSDAAREIQRPRPGELVITEVFADPIGADDERDWVEVANLTDHSIDFQSLTLINRATRERQWPLGDGVSVLLPSSSLGLIGSERHTDGMALVSAVTNFSLYNQASILELRSGDEVIDHVELPDPVEGYALKIVEADAGISADARPSCLAHSPMDTGEFGTPGEANPPCDNSSEQPTPKQGEVVFSEVFANAEGSDDGREFIELFVATERAVDLGSLEITATNPAGSKRRWLIASEGRTIVNPGSYVVVGVEEDPALNGGLILSVLATGPASLLYNSEQELSLITSTGEVLDTTSLPVPIEGVSFSTDFSVSSTGDDGAQGRWCADARSDLFSGIGSPGHPGICE